MRYGRRLRWVAHRETEPHATGKQLTSPAMRQKLAARTRGAGASAARRRHGQQAIRPGASPDPAQITSRCAVTVTSFAVIRPVVFRLDTELALDLPVRGIHGLQVGKSLLGVRQLDLILEPLVKTRHALELIGNLRIADRLGLDITAKTLCAARECLGIGGIALGHSVPMCRRDASLLRESLGCIAEIAPGICEGRRCEEHDGSHGDRYLCCNLHRLLLRLERRCLPGPK